MASMQKSDEMRKKFVLQKKVFSKRRSSLIEKKPKR